MAEPQLQLVNDANGVRGSGPIVSPGYLYPRRAEDGGSIECLLSCDGKLLLKGISPDKAIWYAQQLLNLALECKAVQR